MRELIDLSLNSVVKIIGLKISMTGRLNGVDRCRKNRVVYGVQYNEYKLSLQDSNNTNFMTKYGKIGLKIKRISSLKLNSSIFRVKNE